MERLDERNKAILTTGVFAGLIAGVPQVLLTQLEERLLGLHHESADIGPRFVRRLTQGLETRVPPGVEWALAAGFHFGYAAWWGLLYGMVQEWRPARPLVGGPLLGALIYGLAFSPWGAATRAGAEQSPERRDNRETLLHWSAALAFSLTTAYVYQWLRPERRPVVPLHPPD